MSILSVAPVKEATVRLRHTRGHHYLAEALVVFEHDAHILAAFDGGRLHADVRHGDARVFAFDGEGKFTVVVGHGDCLRPIVAMCAPAMG